MRTLNEMEVAAVSGGDMTPLTDAQMSRIYPGSWLREPYQPIPIY